MELKLLKISGEKTSGSTIKVSDKTFNYAFNETLIHQAVTAHMAALRAGTKAQKTRAEVRGGGAKPWRQKGTGRARAGTTRSPIWRSGGVTFAAKPRNHAQKINKKMYQGAIRAILSELIRQDRLIVVENFAVTSLKTKDLVVKLKELEMKDVLLVTENADENLHLAARNLHQVEVCCASEVNPVNLIAFEKVLLTVPAVKQFEEWLG